MIDSRRPSFERGEPRNKFQTAVLMNCKTFSDFLHFDEDVLDTDGPKSVFRNQLDYVADDHGMELMDFVGHFESLGRDWDYVKTRLSGDPAPLQRLNTSQHDDYREHYTPELASIVADRYARDIERFGYRFGDGSRLTLGGQRRRCVPTHVATTTVRNITIEYWRVFAPPSAGWVATDGGRSAAC